MGLNQTRSTVLFRTRSLAFVYVTVEVKPNKLNKGPAFKKPHGKALLILKTSAVSTDEVRVIISKILGIRWRIPRAEYGWSLECGSCGIQVDTNERALRKHGAQNRECRNAKMH